MVKGRKRAEKCKRCTCVFDVLVGVCECGVDSVMSVTGTNMAVAILFLPAVCICLGRPVTWPHIHTRVRQG